MNSLDIASTPCPNASCVTGADGVVTLVGRGTEIVSESPRAPAAGPLAAGLTVAICTHRRADSMRRTLDSLVCQDPKPERLLIVDASPDRETEQMFRGYGSYGELAGEVVYFRGHPAFRTLTCSRNFALDWTGTDLIVFLDDDVVLLPGCLAEMVRAHRACDDVVGVGGYATNYHKAPPHYWRLRRRLRIVPHLQPGRFSRSGIAIPWSFLPPTDDWVDGEWLMGCAMMWKTHLARRVRFNEGFGGHSTGEDVDFSLRMGRFGKLLVAGKAHLLHLTDSGGRPNTYQMGYTGVRNSYDIHRRCLRNRDWRDGAWFAYAYGLDGCMRGLNLLAPGDRGRRWGFLRGRIRFVRELCTGRFRLSREVEAARTR